MPHKTGKWASNILSQQHPDGTWGHMFHAMVLNQPGAKYPLTTEQALFRLRVLGFDIGDASISKTVACMRACLRGERKIDGYSEKTHDWPLFTQLMLSTWVKLFDAQDDLALQFASRWAEVIEKAFAGGSYNHTAYLAAYAAQFGKKARGAREVDFISFYQLSLLKGVLTPKTEGLMLDYLLQKPDGIFYVYGRPLCQPPEAFASKQASHYVGALELLAGYESAAEKLRFAVSWLNENRDENNQ